MSAARLTEDPGFRDRGGFPADAAANPPRSWNAAQLPLPRGFFDRPALAVAPDLLGCVLVHESADGMVAAQIVEVEAYCGEADPASHAFRGKTQRNAVMFGEPGHAYVYFTYGMHFCVNLVCQPAGEAAAVLLRAGRVVAGTELAAARRAIALAPVRPGEAARGGHGSGRAERAEVRLASGPARLCQALGIDQARNGADVCDPASPLRVLGLAPAGAQGACPVARGPRVGVRLGAEADWRFWLDGNAAVSPYRAHVPRRRSEPRLL